VLVFATLKKRQTGHYRAVPVPAALSVRSTWCMASASTTPAAARDAPSGCGRGRA
jgi:hypothetical protein